MGRHSAPDDDDDDDVIVAGDTVVVAAPAGASRPSPGRHAHAADSDENTAQITPIVDPVLDEPLPAAMTTVIVPVRDDDPAATKGGLVDELLSDDLEADPADAGDDPNDAAAAKPAKPGKAPTPPKPPKPPKAEKPPKAAKLPKPPKAEKPPKRPEPHVSDRALLARDTAARARVIAAVVVPFVLYVVVLLVLDEFDVRTALIWIWLPLITAGVVAGLILDLAHRAAAARAITALEERVSDR